MSRYVVGVDIGTGSTKAVAVDIRGQVLASHVVSYPTAHPQAGFCEQDPDTICAAFFTAVAKVTQTLKINPEAITFSCAMHSLIAVDEKGLALYPMMIWADNRSADIAERVRHSALGELLYEQTGTPIHAMAPLFKIIWLREHKPQIFEKAAQFISIKEYIWFRLFNVFEVDHSLASATGLMNIEDNQWNLNALELAGVEAKQLSRLVSVSFKRSNADLKACAKLGVAQKTVFIIGASDGCLANLGSFATDAGVAALTIGTSSAIRVASVSPVYNFAAMTFNYKLDEETFICGGPSNNGGVALKWYVENILGRSLQTASEYDEILSALYDCPPGADGLIFIPYLFGERAPLWDSHASGSFLNIRGHHKQCHFTRAVIEGISMALYDIAENLIKPGLTIDRIHVSGGFIRSTPWLKILANVFNKKLCLLNNDDASALGAAYMGLKTVEMITDYSSLETTMKEIFPDASIHQIYMKNYESFRKYRQQLIVRENT